MEAVGVEGCSSLHLHQALNNEFVVHKGCLDIEVRYDDGVEYHRLEAGDRIEVEAGLLHRLIVVEPSLFEETYHWHPNVEPWGPPNPQEDIVRVDEGQERFCP